MNTDNLKELNFTQDIDSSQTELELRQKFARLAQFTCHMLSSNGIKARPYVDGLHFFSKLDTATKRKVLKSLEDYYALCSEQINEGYSLKDSASFVWRAMQKLGLTPPTNLFNHLTDEDVIEIYSAENTQLFRNIRFYDFCSYTLEELYCVEWYNLYTREEGIMPNVLALATNVLTGQLPEGGDTRIPLHTVKETQSEENLEVSVRFKWISPVYAHKAIAGLILSYEASLIGSTPRA